MAAATRAEPRRVVQAVLSAKRGDRRGRNPRIEVLPLEANKLADCGLNFLFAHAARPTGRQCD